MFDGCIVGVGVLVAVGAGVEDVVGGVVGTGVFDGAGVGEGWVEVNQTWMLLMFLQSGPVPWRSQVKLFPEIFTL